MLQKKNKKKIHTFLRVLKSDMLFVSGSITVKELKALLPSVNYKAPSTRTLKDKFQVRGLVLVLVVSASVLDFG